MPPESAVQTVLPLFETCSFHELVESSCGDRLTVRTSKRLKNGWYVRFNRTTGMRQLTVPAYLADAPRDIKEALIEWALMPHPRTSSRKRELRKLRKQLESRVWSYANTYVPDRRARRLDPETFETQTRGRVYDLRELFDSLNQRYFNNRLRSALRWGSHASTTSYQTEKTGTDGRPFSLITIAGAYDHPKVPRYAIEGVMFHEMIHVELPTVRRNGRRVIHGPAFKQREQCYPCLEQWRVWERTQLRRLAGALKRRARRKGRTGSK
jgi:hypothetical protein